MNATAPEVCVLLSPRQVGGHELALAAWLGDAVQRHALRPHIVAPGAALRGCFAQSAAAAGLTQGTAGWASVWSALRRWSPERPVLLCPGSLHSHPWLLAAALRRHRQVWVYVPSMHGARAMRARLAALRDALVAPLLRRAMRWIVLTEAHAQALRSAWACHPSEVVVLPNLSRLAGPAPQPPAPDAAGRLRVGFVGRFDANGKGLDWLARRLLADPAWARRHHWRFQGDGPARGLLDALAGQLGADCVTVAGHGPVDAAFAHTDVLLLCSRFEGQPLVALEALQRGRPVVASHESGLGTLLPPEVQFSFGDSAGLARALDHVRSSAQRAAVVAEARRRHDPAAVQQRYDRALADLVSRWRSAAASTPAARRPGGGP